MKNFVLSIILLFASLSVLSASNPGEDSKIKIKSPESIELHSTKTYKIKAKSDGKIHYSSSDEYVAVVNNEGEILAKHLGETIIRIETDDDVKEMTVHVTPAKKLYDIPDVKWGDSKKNIVQKYGKPDFESRNAIAYKKVSSYVDLLTFVFEEDDLVAYDVVNKCGFNIFAAIPLAKFLVERYAATYELDPEHAKIIRAKEKAAKEAAEKARKEKKGKDEDDGNDDSEEMTEEEIEEMKEEMEQSAILLVNSIKPETFNTGLRMVSLIDEDIDGIFLEVMTAQIKDPKMDIEYTNQQIKDLYKKYRGTFKEMMIQAFNKNQEK